MILGIGNDIISIKRLKLVVERHKKRFLGRVYTEFEQHYCYCRKDAILSLAGRFAAKEAVVKALGTGFVSLSWLDVEIRNNVEGKPYLVPSPKLQAMLGDNQVLLSISHCKEYATAVAILISG